MKRKEKLKKFARKAFPIIGISAISATFALALNAKFRGNACCDEVKKNLNSLIKKLIVTDTIPPPDGFMMITGFRDPKISNN